MLNEIYKIAYRGYWPCASQKIYELIKTNVQRTDCICEAGCASGHIMANLALEGYNVSGYEIRTEAYEKAKNKFLEYKIPAKIYRKNILDVNHRFDMLYSIGLLQCLEPFSRRKMIRKMSELSDKIIIVVPQILERRNQYSTEKVGVAGCTEFDTKDLYNQLNESFKKIRSGVWSREELELDDIFEWFVCEKEC